jgi:hypothetical protein
LEYETPSPAAAPPTAGPRLEIITEPGADVASLLAQIRALPGVAAARSLAQLSDDATD